MFDAVLQDARYAARLLWKSPLFTITAALSLAIGIGANTTIFSIVNSLLIRPLPGLAEPSRLVDLGRTMRGQGFDTVSHPYFRAVRERNRTLVDVYAHRLEPTAISLGGRQEAERVYGTVVSGNYFTVLGTRPVVGRMLADSDDVTPGAHPVTVISHELWERRFEANPAIVGQTILLNRLRFTVVGVAPRGFQGTTVLKSDLWVTTSMVGEAVPRNPARLDARQAVWLVMGGRLKPGGTIQQAQSDMDAIAAGLVREFPEDYRDRGIRVAASAVIPGHISIVAGFVGLLMAIVGLVLLIACVNVAGMMLARAAARRREIAVRLAIGAARRQVIRQLMIEAVLVFAAGGLIGLALSRWSTAALLAMLPELPVPLNLALPTDWRVVGFAIAVSLGTALLSGLVPALQASKADLLPALKTEGMDSAPSRLRLRNAFVVGQVTMSLLLVIVAGLFLRALQHAASIQPGFDQDRVDVVGIDLSIAGYNEEAGSRFVREVLDRLRNTPGITDASSSVDLPLDGGRMGLGGLRLPGLPDDRSRVDADWDVVEPGYFRTLKIRLVAGRDFNDRDTSTAPHVAIVNQAFARRAWPNQDPIGQRLLRDGGPRSENNTVTIVGVAADAKLISLGGTPEPFIYVPLAQQPMSTVKLLVRTTGPNSSIPEVRSLLRRMNPNLPVLEALPLSSVTAIGLVPQRIAASVAGSLGLVGLVLAAIGIYGVTAYAVSRRTREIGIRMALGADERRVLMLVLRQGLVLAGIGVAIGIVLAGAGSTLLESLLFGIRGLDPLTFGAACLLFTLVTMIASYIPARRAARVDPMIALRHE
jgi:putative ABC transport system permease protein